MKILYSERAQHTPAFSLIAEGWNELVQTGNSPDGVAISPVTKDSEVVYAALDNGEIVGVLVYGSDWVMDEHPTRVQLAYVEPSSRRKGVFRAMLAELVSRARTLKKTTVVMSSTPENSDVMTVMRKLDIPLTTITFEIGV